MKHGDIYLHHKQNEYKFLSIALPLATLQDKSAVKPIGIARYHEDTHSLNLYESNGVTFIDSDVPFVIYQSQEQYGTGFSWAREVDDFYGYTQPTPDGPYVKRFALQTPS